MSKINDILSSCSDPELAYLYTYRLTDYLPQTQHKIKEYIFRARGLNESKLEELIAAKPLAVFKNNRFSEFRENAKDFLSDLIEVIGDLD